jgi:hypothetical protein
VLVGHVHGSKPTGRYASWASSSELGKAVERMLDRNARWFRDSLEVNLYGRAGFVFPWRPTTVQLRARCRYGGKKARAAIRRLRALGCGPVG